MTEIAWGIFLGLCALGYGINCAGAYIGSGLDDLGRWLVDEDRSINVRMVKDEADE